MTKKENWAILTFHTLLPGYKSKKEAEEKLTEIKKSRVFSGNYPQVVRLKDKT